MNRLSCILLVMAMVVCSTALPTRAEQSQQKILNSLNSTLQTVVYSTQNPGDSYSEQWNNSYQFAVTDNLFIVTYRWDNTYLKGEKIKDHYIETGTYSAPLAMLTQAEITPSSKLMQIAIGCNEEADCFTRDYSGVYEHKGKTTVSDKTKSVNRIALLLPEGLLEPTVNLLKDLLYP